VGIDGWMDGCGREASMGVVASHFMRVVYLAERLVRRSEVDDGMGACVP